MGKDVFFVPCKRDMSSHRYDRIAASLLRQIRTPQWGWGQLGIKVHVGEISPDGEICTHMKPELVRAFGHILKKETNGVFATDSTVNYSGTSRVSVDGHMEVAGRHGFSLDNIGIPFMVADETGCTSVPNHRFSEIWIPNLIYQTAINGGFMLVLSHFKGHEIFGFGGALKNLGMGFVGQATKADIHHFRVRLDQEKCEKCGLCEEICTHGAIVFDDEDSENPKVSVETAYCYGCMACVSACPNDALSMCFGKLGDIKDQNSREKIGRYVTDSLIIAANTAASLFDPGHLLYVTDLSRITAYCDCDVGAHLKLQKEGLSQFLTEQDFGILASQDPVALDQACLDLVLQHVTEKQWHEQLSVFPFYFPVAMRRQLEMAEELGMGSREYTLREREVT